jgi:signal transduction histidine kinase
LEAARRICDSLFKHTGVDKLVEQTLHMALEVVGAEVGSVLLASPDGKGLVFHYSVGAKPVAAGTVIPSDWDKSIAGAVFTSGKPQVISDVKQDPRHFGGIDKQTGYETRDMISLPLKQWEGQPIGVLNVLNKRAGRLSEDDLGILTLVSAFAAVGIEQARLYEEARLAEVVRLLGNISHDIKNMLMPIMTGAKLLESEVGEFLNSLPPSASDRIPSVRERWNEMIDMQLGSAARINHRVKEIADCVKGLTSPPHFVACRLNEIVESVCKTLGVLADEKGVALRMDGLKELPVLMVDEQRLFNAFYNLIDNAIAAVSRGGSVTVKGRLEDAKTVLIAVIDTGRGMPPEVRDSLFTPRAISRKAGGTGLGTKIVKDVVDAHGGTIAVESAEGVGTTFSIRLPLRPPQSRAEP